MEHRWRLNMYLISIVDDNANLLTSLELRFKSRGYSVKSFIDPSDALTYHQQNPADFYLIDYKMPKLNGLEFYESLCVKLKKHKVPALMLTGVAEMHLQSLNDSTIGDFLTKPFEFDILMARIEKILSYYKLPGRSSEYKLGDLTLYEDRISCTWHNTEIELTKVEFAIISQLTRRPNCNFSREDLLDLCYKDNFEIDDRNIDSHIKRIRKKFKDSKPDIIFKSIKTHYGSGYSWSNQ